MSSRSFAANNISKIFAICAALAHGRFCFAREGSVGASIQSTYEVESVPKWERIEFERRNKVRPLLKKISVRCDCWLAFANHFGMARHARGSRTYVKLFVHPILPRLSEKAPNQITVHHINGLYSTHMKI